VIRKPTVALARASLLLLPLLGACTQVPSKSGTGEGAQAKPEDTCKHVRELADKDSDDPAVLDQVERECVETLTTLQTRYETFSTCVGAAADANAVYECEKGLVKPRSLLAGVGPAAKVEQVCEHVFKMLEAQLGEMTAQMQPGELEALRTQCVDDAAKQLELAGPEAFNKEADCILGAKTIEEMQACGL
jgi:hypothetical protein